MYICRKHTIHSDQPPEKHKTRHRISMDIIDIKKQTISQTQNVYKHHPRSGALGLQIQNMCTACSQFITILYHSLPLASHFCVGVGAVYRQCLSLFYRYTLIQITVRKLLLFYRYTRVLIQIIFRRPPAPYSRRTACCP